MRKNILIADCEKEEVKSLASNIFYEGQSFEIKSHIANWKRSSKLAELKRYSKYFAIGFYYFINRRKYNVMIGWQQFYTLIYCFFCWLFNVKKKNIVIALNFTYKEKSGKLAVPYRWFMGKCVSVKYMDYIHVLSEQYADEISDIFRFPRERIIVTRFGVDDHYDEYAKLSVPENYLKERYALAIGRSNRDYDFLIRSWKSVDYPLVIISDTYAGSNMGNTDIEIFKNINGEESYPWIAHCAFMIIPIDNPSVCSGDTVLLTAMSLKRKVVVTAPSTLAEMYIQNGINGILVEKDEYKLRQEIFNIINTDKYDNMGDMARESFLKNFSRKDMGERITAILTSI